MLHKILCDKLCSKEIVFHQGLNAITGDNIASNSIGKSSMLMIIDFVFGGNDYIIKNKDIIDNVGHHQINFCFLFDGQELFFSRSTKTYKLVNICNEYFETKQTVSLDAFTTILYDAYKLTIEGISFRSIIGRYFRIYGKENLSEKKPIKYFDGESMKDSIQYLIKLFGKYELIAQTESELNSLSKEQRILGEAADFNIVPRISQKQYDENNRIGKELERRISVIKNDIALGETDLVASITNDIIELRNRKGQLITKRNKLAARLIRTRENLDSNVTHRDMYFGKLVDYFPDINTELLTKVSEFHIGITKILKDEFRDAAKELEANIQEVDAEISAIDQSIMTKLDLPQTPQTAVSQVVELSTRLAQVRNESSIYEKKVELRKNIQSTKSDLDDIRINVVDEINMLLNNKMREIHERIYSDGRRAPTFNIYGDKYVFATHGATGTGTAFANLITFDLALLELTELPAIAHDLPLLKNIENMALENIINLYAQSPRQVFIAIDKLSSYKKEA